MSTDNNNQEKSIAEAPAKTGDFTITKAMVQSYCEQGLTVDEIADKITAESGIKCSPGVVRKAAKNYSISLRNKPKKSPFKFE